MNALSKVLHMAFDSAFRCSVLAAHGFYNRMDDEKFLKKFYKLKFHKKLDLEHPKTYNEKLQWLKLYDRKPIYTTMVDKFAAKKFVTDRIGEEYVIPAVGGPWKNFDEIDFDELPQKFVFKTTHDCGGVVVCTDKAKLNKAKAREFLTKHLKNDYYIIGREWPYKNVEPRIFAEMYMSDDASVSDRKSVV